MNILFKRDQRRGLFRPTFKLYTKVELSKEEYLMLSKYKFEKSALVDVPNIKLVLVSILFGLLCLVVSTFSLQGALNWLAGGLRGSINEPVEIAIILVVAVVHIVIFFGSAFAFHSYFRESIFVSDLIAGRHFKCKSIVALAKREAWLTDQCAYLRQLLETAKNWSGTESLEVPALPSELAKQVIVKS